MQSGGAHRFALLRTQDGIWWLTEASLIAAVVQPGRHRRAIYASRLPDAALVPADCMCNVRIT